MKLLVLINDIGGFYNFRKELVISMKALGNEVYIAAPNSEYTEDIVTLGAECRNVVINRRGMNIMEEIYLIKQYIDIINELKPDKIITYTIKPNIYGGIASRVCGIRYITAVVGLGSVYLNNGIIKSLVMSMTRFALKRSDTIFFLNKDIKAFYYENKLIRHNQATKVVHGSGVDTNHFKYSRIEDKTDVFLYVGRLFRDKGIYELLDAARVIKRKYKDVSFEIVGFSEDEETQKLIGKAQEEGIIRFHGKHKNVIPYMVNSTCIILPSYGEGCGTVLQEGASIGRPLITCDTYGCRDNVIDGVNGYLCRVADSNSLAEKIEKFIKLSYEEKCEMGIESRRMAEDKFERMKIINAYMDEIL